MKKNTIKPQKPADQVTRPPQTPEEPAQPGSPDKEPLQPTFCKNAAYRFSDQISKYLPSLPSTAHLLSTALCGT